MKANRRRSVLALGGVAALTAAAWGVGGGVSFASGGGNGGGSGAHGSKGGGKNGSSSVCDVPSRYPTIQAAVDATTCKTVKVAPGNYAENVTIGRGLTLQGANAGQDARNRRGRESVVNGGTGAGFTITADNVTIDGFTVNGPVDRGLAALVMQNGNSGETVQNNIVNNAGRAASITTSRTTFRRNVVKNSATANDGFQGNTRPVHDVTISDNSFSGPPAADYNADVTFIEGDGNLTVTGNRSSGDGTLVALFKTTGAQITGNTVSGTANSSAIYIGGANRKVTVSDNTVSSAASGVKVANDFNDGTNSAVTISRNTLRKNQYGVNVAKASTSDIVQATRNSITGNALYGVFNDPASGASTNATCNWWGDVRGPGHGDKVSSGVTYQPWLKLSSLIVGCR
jgi:hypothetical protein